jgi:hypothetical protein
MSEAGDAIERAMDAGWERHKQLWDRPVDEAYREAVGAFLKELLKTHTIMTKEQLEQIVSDALKAQEPHIKAMLEEAVKRGAALASSVSGKGE